MPATSARIAYISEIARRSAVFTSSAMATAYGSMARDTKDEPVESFFDAVADAQTFVDERGAVLGKHARFFEVDVDGLLETLDLSQSIPAAAITDDTLVLSDFAAAVVGIAALNYETRTTTLLCWGVYS